MYAILEKKITLRKNWYYLLMVCLCIASYFNNCFAKSPTDSSFQVCSNTVAGSLLLSENEIKLTIPKHFTYVFCKNKDGKWLWKPILVWNSKSGSMTPTFYSKQGNFFSVEKDTIRQEVYAERYDEIRKENVVGIKFYGTTNVGTDLKWQVTFTIDSSTPLPFVKVDIKYSVKDVFELNEAPGISLQTFNTGKESASISNIMGYLRSEQGGQITLEQDYPVVWLKSCINGKHYNTLSIIDIDDKDENGSLVKKTFSLGRSQTKSSYSTHFTIANKTANLSANRVGEISVNLYHSLDDNWLSFYRNTWSGLIDYFCPPAKTPFWAKNWEECANGLMENLKDKDGDLYIPGKGYIIGAGGTHTHWFVATQFTHGILYYCWATNDTGNFNFYQQRLKECNIADWWTGPANNDGVAWGRSTDGRIQTEGNLWQMLDFGAYPVFNIYQLTGDKYYMEFFKRYMDYVMANLTENNSLGEWWDVKKKGWVYHKDGEFHESKSSTDHQDYPGALAVYTYLCLLTYEETGDVMYKEKAFEFIDHINSFLSNPGQLYTIAPDTKTNGFAFAMMANLKRYELTKKTEHLDNAEQWAYIMLTMYSLVGGKDVAFAHAGGQGLGEFFCVATLESIEPTYLLASLLKYRVNPAFLKFLALADRRHLGAFPVNHKGYGKDTKHLGLAKDLPWHKYLYIPLELVPQSSDPAIYMAGAPMVENLVLHGLHNCSDDEITVICTDAAETSMEIKRQRNLVIYNPTKTKRDFVVSFTGFEVGNYNIRLNEQKDMTFSNLQLEKGIPLTLEAENWVRLTITHTN